MSDRSSKDNEHGEDSQNTARSTGEMSPAAVAAIRQERALTSQAAVVPRPDSSMVRQGYSNSELKALYSLGYCYVLNGENGLAERVARGLVAVAPEFTAAWLLLAYIAMMKEDYNETIFSARQALRIHAASVEGLLFLVMAYFQAEDYQTGGTYLGEVADLIRSEHVRPELKKLYESQVVRFEERLKSSSRFSKIL